jgi:hypothetical protein
MTGAERMEYINRYYAALARARAQQFFSGTLSILPCWGDEVDAAIAAQLDLVRGPVPLGLWFWEVEQCN